MYLELERVCPACNGAGVRSPDQDAPLKPCPRCEGRGALPTDQGRQLLDFIGKYHHLIRP